MRLRIRSFIFIIALLLTACNTTKFVPDGEFLLDKSSITTDNKSLSSTTLKEFLRQTPNAGIFGAFRMQLGIYNFASEDSTKWLTKTFKKIGDPPVIYSPLLTDLSCQQIQQFLNNKGYVNAKVENNVTTKRKKAKVEYIVKANSPYKLGEYNIDIKNSQLAEIASDSSKSLIQPEMLFDTDILNAERERITTTFRKKGYYNFNKDFFTYIADSTLKPKTIDVSLELRDFLKRSNDSIYDLVFKQYSIRKVVFYIKTDAAQSLSFENSDKLDTLQFRDFILITPSKKILSLDALVQNTFINPNSIYSDEAVEKTYQSLNSLGPIKYVNISFKESDVNLLDCSIIIVPSKTISLSAEMEGTYTAGYWGIGGNLNYVNRNIFNGAEALTLQSRTAFEWQKDVLAQEYAGQIGLKFPRFMLPIGSYEFKRNIHASTEFTSIFSYQLRPGEFTTTSVGAGINYSWSRSQYRHNFQLFDLNYVQFPIIEQAFRDNFLTTGKYNSYNYTDHLIMRMGYSGSYSSYNTNQPMKNYSTMRYSIETAGNFLYAMSNLLGSTKQDDSYQFFKVSYSQYAKAEYNISRHHIFNRDSRLVYHLGVGSGTPYGNGSVIPYEKRFYSGGANSVRGWSESQLGPGKYNRIAGSSRDFNQVGDIKLDLNMEYRGKMFWVIESALFLDAGNVWTIKEYPTQALGQFKLNSFMSELAVAYGGGLRMDFSFFILRFDLGIKLFNPVLSASNQWRIVPKLKDDFTLHFAIGYPF